MYKDVIIDLTKALHQVKSWGSIQETGIFQNTEQASFSDTLNCNIVEEEQTWCI